MVKLYIHITSKVISALLTRNFTMKCLYFEFYFNTNSNTSTASQIQNLRLRASPVVYVFLSRGDVRSPQQHYKVPSTINDWNQVSQLKSHVEFHEQLAFVENNESICNTIIIVPIYLEIIHLPPFLIGVTCINTKNKFYEKVLLPAPTPTDYSTLNCNLQMIRLKITLSLKHYLRVCASCNKS